MANGLHVGYTKICKTKINTIYTTGKFTHLATWPYA